MTMAIPLGYKIALFGGILFLIYIVHLNLVVKAIYFGESFLDLVVSLLIVIASFFLTAILIHQDNMEVLQIHPQLLSILDRSFLPVSVALIIYGIVRGHHLNKHAPFGRRMIKEALDDLPLGLAYSWHNQHILLSNWTLDHLSVELTGHRFHDPEAFWEMALAENHLSELETWSDRNVAFIEPQRGEGNQWLLSQETIVLNGQAAQETIALNIEEEARLYFALQEEVDNLRRSQRELTKYSQLLRKTLSEQAKLTVCSDLHESFGQALLLSRHALQHDSVEAMEDSVEHWKALLKAIQDCANIDQLRDFEDLRDFAEILHVQLRVFGDLPQQEGWSEVLLLAASEALTNAVRHARASVLTIEVQSSEDAWTVRFMNNGLVPLQEGHEGGGLSHVRHCVEEKGGTMNIRWKPQFILEISSN